MLLSELQNPPAVYLVAEGDDGTVLGYAGMHCVLDEGYITNVAVLPARRKEGVASAILLKLLARARLRGLQFLTLEVRESNTPAISLYEKFGFAPVGRRKNYYTEPTEDALLLFRELPEGGEAR